MFPVQTFEAQFITLSKTKLNINFFCKRKTNYTDIINVKRKVEFEIISRPTLFVVDDRQSKLIDIYIYENYTA